VARPTPQFETALVGDEQPDAADEVVLQVQAKTTQPNIPSV
jgi:hypothetical protein